jgi:predicted phosphodiesterase
VVALMGDFVSGGLHPELLATDEAEILPSVLHAADLLAASLTRMADFFGRLYVPAVCGNHGRLTRKPEFKRYTAKNADFMIYEILRGRLAGDSRIRIDFRAENDMHWRVYNLRFAQTHGDMLGVKGGDGIIGAMGPIMRGEIKTGKQMAAIGRDYDILLMGHWHQMLWLPRAIVANSLKGWDEYARLSLRAPPSRPSQPLFFVHPRHGITSQWQVWADEGPAPAEENWISGKE